MFEAAAAKLDESVSQITTLRSPIFEVQWDIGTKRENVQGKAFLRANRQFRGPCFVTNHESLL